MNDPRLIASAAVIAGVVLVSLLARRLVGRLEQAPEQRQRTRNVIRYGLLLVLVVGLLIVWADLVTQAALVASGFAVAIVLFNKDLILNILGWWQKTMSGAYRIGDRVHIGDHRGDVLDYGLLSTTLMQVDAHADHGMRTGNVVTFPNMLLLTSPVVNETLVLGFEWKEYCFSVKQDERIGAEEALLKAAEELLRPHRDEVEISLKKMTSQYAFHPIEVKPRVFVGAGSDGGIKLTLRLATPARSLRVTHDALTRAFLQWREGSTKP